jgi:sulfate permease, SulP family
LIPFKIRYNWRIFLGDISGGFVAALIAMPYGLALATVMGLPPVLGLFTSILTAPLTTLLGRNPVLIGGTASATIPFFQLAVSQQGLGGAAKVALVAGVCMMVFSTLKLGGYISKIPHSVVSGFSCGIGAMMVILQLKTLLGLKFKSDPGSTNSLYFGYQVLEHLGDVRWQPFLLGAVVILVCFVVAHYKPRWPAPLVGLLVALAVNFALNLHEAEVGKVSFAVPDFAGFVWKPSDVFHVLPSGAGLALIASVNILVTSRVVEHFRGRHRPLRRGDADAELGAYGIANVCAGFFGAPLSVGIPARSLANVRSGGTTRMSNLYHGFFLIAILLLGSGVIAVLPLPALAGVTIYMGICLLDWATWGRLTKMRRADAAAFLVTAISILLFNAVAAVAAGCAMYLVPLFRQKWSNLREAQMSPAQNLGSGD